MLHRVHHLNTYLHAVDAHHNIRKVALNTFENDSGDDQQIEYDIDTIQS